MDGFFFNRLPKIRESDGKEIPVEQSPVADLIRCQVLCDNPEHRSEKWRHLDDLGYVEVVGKSEEDCIRQVEALGWGIKRISLPDGQAHFICSCPKHRN